MNENKILIIGAGLEQKLVVNKAKEMQLKTICVDFNPNALCRSLVDEFYVGDIRDENFLIDIMKKTRAIGLICHAVDIPVTVAKVNKALGISATSPEIIERATDKIQRSTHLKKNNLNCANFSKVKSLDDLKSFWNQKSTSSVILKPIDNSGSRGVVKITSIHELEEAFKYSKSFTTSSYLIVEDFLKGLELSTESIILGGEIYTFAIADRNYSNSEFYHPYFVEDGINYPSHFSTSTLNKVQNFTSKVINTLELKSGTAKGDLLMMENEPYLIEMAPRSSGGWFGAGSMKYATGVDYIEVLIKMAIGENISPKECMPKFSIPCAQRYLIPTESGTVTAVNYPRDLASSKNVKMLELFLPKVGDKIQKAQNHSQRFAQVICTSDSLEEAIQSCDDVINSIEICIEKKL